MLTFAVALFFLIITPGPGVLTVAGVGSGFGFRAGIPYMLGIVIGAQVLMLAVATGLAAAIFAVPYVREVLLTLSVAYLLYLALKIALSGKQIAFIESAKAPKFRDGFILAIINPKGYAVGTALYSGFQFYPDSLLIENTIKLVIQFVVTLPLHFLWLYAGASLHRLDLSPTMARFINVAMALTMVAVVVLAVVS
jgi:threonine/homoserine/homoserine lactone efflux protein